MLGCSAERAGLQFHSESSQPEPVAGADPLTHFLSPSPAPCQGEPLVEEKKGKQERARNQRLKRGKEKKRSCWKYRGQREAGKAWNVLAVWGLEQQPTHPSPELLNSPSKLPATATTQTSLRQHTPCAKLRMTTQELSRYFRNNVHTKAATSLRWKVSWSDVRTADSTRRSGLNGEWVRHVWVYEQNDTEGGHLLRHKQDWG